MLTTNELYIFNIKFMQYKNVMVIKIYWFLKINLLWILKLIFCVHNQYNKTHVLTDTYRVYVSTDILTSVAVQNIVISQ